MDELLEHCRLRPWRTTDAASLSKHANDHGVWKNLRDRFPHPYTLADAEEFLGFVVDHKIPRLLAIEVDDEAVGGVGFELRGDVERIGAELGYWLGRAHWGQGIMTEVVRASTRWALTAHGLERVFALPFTQNRASCRVLEEAGFVLEGTLRRNVIKEGEVHDQALYAFVPGAGDVLR